MLVEFLINNCSEIFEEDIGFPACALAQESSEHTDSSTGMRTDWECHQLGLLGQIIEFDIQICQWFHRRFKVVEALFSTLCSSVSPLAGQ